jgi:hypothetical protein
MVISLGGWLISAETFFLSVLTVSAGGVATFLLTIHKPEEKITVIKQRRS